MPGGSYTLCHSNQLLGAKGASREGVVNLSSVNHSELAMNVCEIMYAIESRWCIPTSLSLPGDTVLAANPVGWLLVSWRKHMLAFRLLSW